jgi:hypothetical protein
MRAGTPPHPHHHLPMNDKNVLINRDEYEKNAYEARENIHLTGADHDYKTPFQTANIFQPQGIL